MANRLSPEERALRAAERAEDARINELYAAGAMGRLAPKPGVAEPVAYRVTQLTSAYTRKQAALKAAATRRMRRYGLA